MPHRHPQGHLFAPATRLPASSLPPRAGWCSCATAAALPCPTAPASSTLPHAAPHHHGSGSTTTAAGAPLLALLEEHGLAGSYDFVPGLFCDGQYNLVIGGRKVTGTAQRRLAPGRITTALCWPRPCCWWRGCGRGHLDGEPLLRTGWGELRFCSGHLHHPGPRHWLAGGRRRPW